VDKQLYIPHGSDNTLERVTTLQRQLNPFFISHMVQIILVNLESSFQLRHNHLYIPHGSDNTSTVTVNLPDDLELYIPHGSDNTLHLPSSNHLALFFISHMVQIIQRNSFRKKTFESVFISHMVQIIPIIASKSLLPLRLLYIPHGSDNTWRTLGGWHQPFTLYPTWFR